MTRQLLRNKKFWFCIIALAIIVLFVALPLFPLSLHANPIHVRADPDTTQVTEKVQVEKTIGPNDPYYDDLLAFMGSWGYYYSPRKQLPNTVGEIKTSLLMRDGHSQSSSDSNLPVYVYFVGWYDGRMGQPYAIVYSSTTLTIPEGSYRLNLQYKVSGMISFEDSGSTNIYWYVTEPSPTPTPTPTPTPQPTPPPSPPILNDIWATLTSFWSSIWNSIRDLLGFHVTMGSLSITSGETIEPGDFYSSTLTLTNLKGTSIPDSNYQDGSASFAYTLWMVVDESGNIIYKGQESEVSNLASGASINVPITWKVPDDIASGKYAVVALLVEIPMTWNGDQWVQGDLTVVDKAVEELNVQSPIPPPSPPTTDIWSQINNVIQSILDWLRRLFSW